MPCGAAQAAASVGGCKTPGLGVHGSVTLSCVAPTKCKAGGSGVFFP